METQPPISACQGTELQQTLRKASLPREFSAQTITTPDPKTLQLGDTAGMQQKDYADR